MNVAHGGKARDRPLDLHAPRVRVGVDDGERGCGLAVVGVVAGIQDDPGAVCEYEIAPHQIAGPRVHINSRAGVEGDVVGLRGRDSPDRVVRAAVVDQYTLEIAWPGYRAGDVGSQITVLDEVTTRLDMNAGAVAEAEDVQSP